MVSSDNIFVINNIMEKNGEDGISMSWVFGTTIIGNIILNSSNGAALNIDHVSDTRIEKNTLKNSKYGIKIWNEVPRIPFTEKTIIRDNNFLDNTYSAGIKSEVSILFTKFSHNYWDRSRGLPKLIYKFDYPFPLPLNIDWNPAEKPYEI